MSVSFLQLTYLLVFLLSSSFIFITIHTLASVTNMTNQNTKLTKPCQDNLGLTMHEISHINAYEVPCNPPTPFSPEPLSYMQLTVPRIAGAIHNLVPFDYTICSSQRRRDPWNSDGLWGECGACGILRRLLRNSFGRILTRLLWHGAWTNLVKCLYHYGVLGVCPVTQNTLGVIMTRH